MPDQSSMCERPPFSLGNFFCPSLLQLEAKSVTRVQVRRLTEVQKFLTRGAPHAPRGKVGHATSDLYGVKQRRYCCDH
jgi:hypothetical protein